MWNPLSWVMEFAAIVAIALTNGKKRTPDWQDFTGIIVLLFLNSTISYVEETNAGSAAASLMSRLAPKAKVRRDGQWSEQDASILVPGDIISLKLGDIIPADVILLEGDPLQIDQSALTGESLAVTKRTGEQVLSGSICKQGEAEAVVMATGVHTFLGKAAHLVHSTDQAGHFQKARQNIKEVHFLPFNPIDKRTASTYIEDGHWYRASKGATEQILNMCDNKEEVAHHFHHIVRDFAKRGFRSLAVAWQEIPEKRMDSQGGPWHLCGIIPLFDPPRHDSAETLRRALDLGINIKMLTGDQLAIAKETGRMLGMGTNMYPSSLLSKDFIDAMPLDEVIENADGFAGVFPEHKFEIVKRLQQKKHICGMTGDGVNDAPALKKADIGIAVAGATDAARSASDIVLTEPGLTVIISAVLTSRAIFQRMKNYTIYAVSITIRIVVGFLLLALVWKFDFSPFMVLIIAILNDGTIMTISKDRVKPSPFPDSWKLKEIFTTGIILGTYLALMTVIFFWVAHRTNFFEEHFHVTSIGARKSHLTAAIYLQVSIISQALIFVTRSQGWSFLERPGLLLLTAFILAQLIATFIAVYANWGFARMRGIGWKWAGVIWLYSLITYMPLDIIKFVVRYALSEDPWNLLFERKTPFTSKVDFGKEEREAEWARANLPLDLKPTFERDHSKRVPPIVERAKLRAEIVRLQGPYYSLTESTFWKNPASKIIEEETPPPAA